MLEINRKQKVILHLTWIAFFLTFLVWFNMAPFNTTLRATLGLTAEQIQILMICNVALTIPARIVIGSLVDRLGPKKVFVALLLFSSAVTFYFSMAQSFTDFLISRLLMGIVGASFVVGIKMISEWFPPEKMGAAQGLYAGWGNFGAAAAAFSLPSLAVAFSPENGWRAATVFSGILCLIWAYVYHRWAHEVPERDAEFRLGLEKTIEITSIKDLALEILLMIPLYGAVLTFLWKLSTPPTLLLSGPVFWILSAATLALLIHNTVRCLRFNLPRIRGNHSGESPYEFRQIVILSLVYALTFGSELAVISMFPDFLATTFGLSMVTAGILGSSFSFFNLVTRPGGGWISDHFGRRRTLFLLVIGTAVCYGFMSGITAEWSLTGVLGLAVLCSVFIQAGNGACFAAVPLIRPDLTGKLAGVAGAYGNVGAVFFLVLLSLFGPQSFFKWIGAYALFVFTILFFLKPFGAPDRSNPQT